MKMQTADHLRSVKKRSGHQRRGYRIYRELELHLRIKPIVRRPPDRPNSPSAPVAINQVSSIDFMSKTLLDKRTCRSFDVIDDFN